MRNFGRKVFLTKEEAEKAQSAAKSVFGAGGNSENMPSTTLSNDDFTDEGINIIDVLIKAQLVTSRGEARRLIEQGGVSVDNEKVTALSISGLEEKVKNLDELESTVESLDNLLKANNPPVASPVISVTWTFTDTNGNDVTSSIQNIGNAKNPKVEKGYIAGYSATYNYTIGSNQQAPNGVVSGSSWTAVPEILSGNTSEASELISSYNISTDKELSITLKAKQVGLKVSNGVVSPTTEDDFIKSTTDTAAVTFYNRKFYGLTDDTEITSETLNNLSGNVLTNTKGLTTEKITTKTQHYVFAYPERLSKIKANGTDAWDKTITTEQAFIEGSLTLTNNAGKEVLYYTYRTTNIGALDNTELVFS